MNDTIDPQVKNLVSAIGRAETGDPSPDAYTKQGKSGEFGRYQFMPDTWKLWAGKHLGDPNAQPTMENQNKVAYAQVKEWKDAGLNPAQIASKWNSGSENAYKENNTGTNSQGVSYDTPAYTQKVSQYYQQLKGGQSNVSQLLGQNPAQATSVDQQRTNMEAQGQPVSVNPNKTGPSFVGGLIREPLKLGAELATNVINAGQTALGAPTTQPFSGKYLGEVKPIGQEGTFGQKLKETAGKGLEAASYVVGGGEAGAGVKALQEGSMLAKPLLRTALKGVGEGSAIGTLAGAGGELQKPDSTLGSTLVQGGIGGLLGGATGGILGAGGSLLEKSGIAKGLFGNSERINNAKKDLYNAYQEGMGTRQKEIKFMQKDEALGKDTLGDIVDHGIIPEFNADGTRLDMTKGMGQIEAMDNLFKPALGKAVQAENKQIPFAELEKQLMSQISRYKNTADETPLLNEIRSRLDQFKRNGDMTDLVNLQDIKNKASSDSVGAYNPLNDNVTSIKKRAAKELFYATKKVINNNVATDSAVKDINKVLEKNHRMMDLADMLHGSVVKRGKVGKYVAELLGGGIGMSHGPFGVLAGAHIVSRVQSFIIKNSFGSPASRALLDTLQASDKPLYDEVIKKIEEASAKRAGMLRLPAPGETSAPMFGTGEIKTPQSIKQEESAMKAGEAMKIRQNQSSQVNDQPANIKNNINPKNPIPENIPQGEKNVKGLLRNDKINPQSGFSPAKALAVLGTTTAGALIADKALKNKNKITYKAQASTEPVASKIVSTKTKNETVPNSVPKEYVSEFTKVSKKYGVPMNWLAAVIKHESHWNPTIVNPKNKDTGLGQHTVPFIKQYRKQFEKEYGHAYDPKRPYDNLHMTAMGLADLHKQFGNWEDAITAYNNGATATKGILRRGEKSDYLQLILKAMD